MNFTPRRIRLKHAREFEPGSWAILRLNHADETIAQLIAERENQEAAYAIKWLQKVTGCEWRIKVTQALELRATPPE
jgi:hypothetical protein